MHENEIEARKTISYNANAAFKREYKPLLGWVSSFRLHILWTVELRLFSSLKVYDESKINQSIDKETRQQMKTYRFCFRETIVI